MGNKQLIGFGWSATIAGVLGAFLVADKVFLLGYSLFLYSSLGWLILGSLKRDWALAGLNACFLCANILGVWNNV